MGIGRTKDNFAFYTGYEGEPEIILDSEENGAVHIWEGYFDDIYSAPSLDGKGWKGFTRDYHQFEGIFSDKGGPCTIDPVEYLEDLMHYKGKSFDFEETSDVFDLMAAILEEAAENQRQVKANKV